MYRARYRAKGRVRFGADPASVWRGLLGRFLHQTASPTAADSTLYRQLFRTPRSAVDVPERPTRILGPLGLTGQHLPHPFVLRVRPAEHRAPGVTLDPGDTTTCELVLIEAAIEHVPALCAALKSIGEDGVGRKTRQPSGGARRGPMTLGRASLHVGSLQLNLFENGRWQLPGSIDTNLYDQAAAITANKGPSRTSTHSRQLSIELASPLRLKHDGSILTPDEFTPEALALALYRRLGALTLCYGNSPPSTEALDRAFQTARELGRKTTLASNDLEQVTRERYSARQERCITRDVLLGQCTLEASPEAIGRWHRWLSQAEPLHLGKNTSIGYGWLRSVAAPTSS